MAYRPLLKFCCNNVSFWAICLWYYYQCLFVVLTLQGSIIFITMEEFVEVSLFIEMCVFCQHTPCVMTDSSEYLGFRAAHVQNHVWRWKNYKTYWSALKKCRLWKDPIYLAGKVELGDHVDTVRERMPKCIVKDMRSRFPNPPGIPYMGHKRE